MKSDLHVHSTHSDGSFSVGEILDLAKHLHIDCIALTDHDVVSGVEEAIDYGTKIGIKVIPGIEFSASSSVSVHILGYNIDYKSPILHEVLSDLLEKRRIRKDKIIVRLRELGININEDNLPTVNVGRSHIAREMRDQGFAGSIAEAFDKYLGDGKAAYVPSGRITPMAAVKLIKELGGKAVIAHPINLYKSGRLKDLIEGLRPYGLSGLEVYYPSHTTEDIYQLSMLADRYRLIKTGGSDFHGLYKGMGNNLGASTCELPRELY